ncbi:Zn-dependent alcohol dehydrogenase [Sporichthya sp.]|uniref:Zn-dependent alcohol dehydrogenase n=1 Tax=Sporichthya sp. TaxID=65475 RepID=UPI0017F40203|nr:Zn-dependent alcohol dehydrogenase [Sporichthya sp.]MBA3743684.1 Zn-dependent alcohol dehydrogenase [Sporichthya sp.]
MTVRAAVCTQLEKPLEVLDLELAEPRAGEVAVRIMASGICASDASVQKGALPSPLPIVLGHEGAGVIEAVGPGVTHLAAGDHVAVCAMPQCGHCYRCTRGQPGLCERGDGVLFSGALMDGSTRWRTADGVDVAQFVAAGTFAEQVVVPTISVVKIPADMPFAPASLLGCAVLTGVGAALNTAAIRPGGTVAVIGCGSVGLMAIQGARLAGAERIIAIDLVPAKLEIARAVGATDTLAAGEVDVLLAVKELTAGRGTDTTIEAVGAQVTVDQAIRMTGKGGEVVFVGAGTKGVRINVPQFTGLVGSAKTFKGCLFGSADTHRDIPRLVERYLAGELHLDVLVSRTYGLSAINEGLAAVTAGEVISAVVNLESLN